MPLLNDGLSPATTTEISNDGGTSRFFPACANPQCTSGWLHLWRKRQVPIIEGRWTCSPDCARSRIEAIVRREMKGPPRPSAMHRHRIPIGLILLAEGWISHEQLKKALEAQKKGAAGRIGAWLMENCGLDERHLTQALSIQWNCPVFSLSKLRTAATECLVPRLLLETFGLVPLKTSREGILYIAFEERIDHSVILAIESMTGLTVEAGILSGSEFRRSQQTMTAARFPRARLIEASSVDSLTNALTKLIEREKPADSRLVRVQEFFWLRFWRRVDDSDTRTPAASQFVEDVICSLDGLG
jgi:hypothetical protein